MLCFFSFINMYYLYTKMFIHIVICFIITCMCSFIECEVESKDIKIGKPLNLKLVKATELNYDPGTVDVNTFSLTDIFHSEDCRETLQNSSDTSLSSVPYGIEKLQTIQKEILNKLDYLSNKIEDLEKTKCHYATTSEGITYDTLCQRMVGVSKPPTCKIIDDNHIQQIQSMKKVLPKSCHEIYESGQNKSGLYEIQPKSGVKPLAVLCDMETRSGGWTHIQKRFDGSEDFYREWRDYRFGFGDLKGEFWIGLENVHHFTGFGESELLVEITDRDKIKGYAHYTGFSIGSESDGYPLNILNGFTGDVEDSLSYHLGSKFTTKDLDQDEDSTNCAETYLGAWWYKSCHESNLNGKYINVVHTAENKYQGLNWNKFRGLEYIHAGSRMLVRPAKT